MCIVTIFFLNLYLILYYYYIMFISLLVNYYIYVNSIIYDNCPKIMYIRIIDARDINKSNVVQMMNN